MSAVAEGRALLSSRARSFRWAAWWLGRQAHDEAALVYGFCRMADDAADAARSESEARAALARLREALSGDRCHEAVEAYRALAVARGFGLGPARALLSGVESDVGTVRMADDAALLRYARLVAGTVGLMMCMVLGATSRRARGPAVALGVGMQLTNVCRDVLEDAAMGRVYLPARRLRAQGLEPDALVEAVEQGRVDARVRCAVSGVVGSLLALADRHYARAERGVVHLPPRARLAVLVASRLYRAIGLRLLRAGCDPLAGRTVLPTWEKCWWTVTALGQWLRTLLSGRSSRNEV